MTLGEIGTWSLQDLVIQHSVAEASAASAKTKMAAIRDELTRRYGARLEAALDAKGKSYGEVTVEIDGRSFKGDVKRKVKWDSAKLMAAANALAWPWEKISRFFKIEFSVPEATYKAISDDELARLIAEARTTTYDQIVVSLVPNKD